MSRHIATLVIVIVSFSLVFLPGVVNAQTDSVGPITITPPEEVETFGGYKDDNGQTITKTEYDNLQKWKQKNLFQKYPIQSLAIAVLIIVPLGVLSVKKVRQMPLKKSKN